MAKTIYQAGKYVQDEADGEWFDFTFKHGVRQQCCSCSLVHDIAFRWVTDKRTRSGRRMQMRFIRHERATAAARRNLKKNVVIVEE
jgi:hypothetical protein